jgi:mannose-6-phosphate isomerase-like protein (cupin superfamily)
MTGEIHKKVWGSEEWIVNTDKYCGKKLNLKKGYRCSIHYHKNKDETFFIMSGRVLLELDGKQILMKKNDSQRVLPLQKHRFTGLTDSEIIEFSTHHEDSDSYRDTESGKISDSEFEELNKRYSK